MARILGISTIDMTQMILDMDDNGDGIIQREEWVNYVRKLDGYCHDVKTANIGKLDSKFEKMIELFKKMQNLKI